jgi:two-component system OmpR family sensor kinase/two-component system sensor histidine kinase BaeS
MRRNVKEHPRWRAKHGPRWAVDHARFGEPIERHYDRLHRPGYLFFRLTAVFGFVALLALGAVAATVFLLMRLVARHGQAVTLLWVAIATLAATLITFSAMALGAFRGVAKPLAEVMAAAQAVAAGDLSIRVHMPSHGPHAFARLVVAFNHMVEELDRADQRRRNLTADVAHELRTPLHILQGNLEGVLDGVYEPTAEHIGATLEEAQALARLIDDLGTLSLAEAGELPLTYEHVDVRDLVADVCTSFGGPAEVAGVELSAAVKGSGAMTIAADSGRVEQVLANLVSNALRHTGPGGKVVLEACTTPAGVRITVRDTGEGIPTADLPYIFDRFWKGDRSRSRAKSEGSGLGLAIARQLVQAHGGSIEVDSTVGRGTMFTVDLPANTESRQAE